MAERHAGRAAHIRAVAGLAAVLCAVAAEGTACEIKGAVRLAADRAAGVALILAGLAAHEAAVALLSAVNHVVAARGRIAAGGVERAVSLARQTADAREAKR